MVSTIHNMNKLVFLANEQKTNHLHELNGKMFIPVLDYDLAMYEAEQRGYIKVSKNKKTFTVEDIPTNWVFDSGLLDLLTKLTDLFEFRADRESDVEEDELTSMMYGYLPHDQLVAMGYLLNTKQIETYELTNTTKLEKSAKPVKDTYTFYCLPENQDKQWGLKQFEDQKRVK